MLRTMEAIVIESARFTKVIIALFPASMLLCGAAIQYLRGESTSSLLRLLGAWALQSRCNALFLIALEWSLGLYRWALR